jgi:hypothetical protein
VIDESDLQDEKHFDPTISTLRGIMIDWSEDDENASDSIRVKSEFDSNKMDWSFVWVLKYACLRMKIHSGIQTRRLSIQLDVEGVIVSIDPHRTTIRRQ